MIRKQVKLKNKSLFRRLIKVITSDEDINFRESFNSVTNKKARRLSKKSKSKRKVTKTG